jgi:hypothetical protein
MSRLASGGLLLLLLVGCKQQPNQPAEAAASASAAPPPSAAAAPPVAPPPARPTTPEPTCRALGVEGRARVGDAELRSGAELDGSAWVTLDPGASLTLKHTSSGRELLLSGPAQFRACRRGREQLLLVRGTVQGGGGMGSRPGAEVLIATPIATARYADADFTLKLDDKRLTLEVRAGQVAVDSAQEPPPKSLKTPLHAKDKLSLPVGKPDPARLMARCQAAAEAAEATARKVGDRSSSEPLGQRAQAHVRARREARAACTVAATATGLVADPDANAGLWAEASRWEGLWEAVPRPSPVPAPEK